MYMGLRPFGERRYLTVEAARSAHQFIASITRKHGDPKHIGLLTKGEIRRRISASQLITLEIFLIYLLWKFQ